MKRKKVILVITEHKIFSDKKSIEKNKIRDLILVQHKDKIDVEFYNAKGLDLFNLKLNKIIRSNTVFSVFFYHCTRVKIERIIEKTDKRIDKKIPFFFCSLNMIGLDIKKAKEITMIKNLPLFLTAVSN